MIRYLTEEELILINIMQIKKYSPKEQLGVKEPKALNACIELPKQAVFGEELYPSVEEKAAILFQKLIQKHCFFNANKRTAVVALHTFLRLNHLYIEVSNDEMENYAVEIATNKKITVLDISEWIQEHTPRQE